MFPHLALAILATDVGVMFLVTLYGAYRTKRVDVIKWFPVSYFIGHLSTIWYIKAFVEIVILRKEILAWNKVARYDFSNHLGT
jgi:hypothetical protein